MGEKTERAKNEKGQGKELEKKKETETHGRLRKRRAV